MEWGTDTKTGYDDLEIYMEYGYVFVSSTGRNHVKMVAFSFKNPGWYINNQWIKICEAGILHDAHKILNCNHTRGGGGGGVCFFGVSGPHRVPGIVRFP